MMTRFLPILCLIIAGGIFFGYINPQINGSIAATSKEIAKHDSALTAAKRFEEKRAQLAAAQKGLPQDAVKRLESYLPDGVNNVQLILDLDAVAASSGLRLSDFNITESGKSIKSSSAADATGMAAIPFDTGKPTDSLDLSVTATGSYESLRVFLAAIETSLRPLDLVEFHLTTAQGTNYTYQISFRLYWLR